MSKIVKYLIMFLFLTADVSPMQMKIVFERMEIFDDSKHIKMNSNTNYENYKEENAAITIAEAKLDANNDFIPDRLDEIVSVSGIVLNENFGLAGISIFIQDVTAGINIYSTQMREDLTVGDEVLVTGQISEYRGLAEIVVSDVQLDIIIMSKNNIIEPVQLTIAELYANAEFYESTLIKILQVKTTNNSAEWPQPGFNSNLTITDESGLEIILRIDKETDLDENLEPTWPCNLIGIIGQYSLNEPPDDGYQILPRYLNDFIYVEPNIVEVGTSEITSSSCNLSCLVKPNSNSLNYYVEYGSTTNYGFHTPNKNLFTDSYSILLNENISGLNSNTSFHYRFVVSNSSGTDTSDDRIFTTSLDLDLQVPNGNEIWHAKTKELIKWNSFDSNATVNLEYTINGGFSWDIIDSLINVDVEQYQWHIPNTPSDQCYVKISDSSDPNSFDINELPFIITLFNSQTHPNSYLWYYNNNLSISWSEYVSNLNGYLYLVDQNESTIVTITNSEFTPDTSHSSSEYTHGDWYFHLAAVDNSSTIISGSQQNYRFRINTEKPIITSFTHPDTNFNYLNKDLEISLSPGNGILNKSIANYYYIVDQLANTLPDKNSLVNSDSTFIITNNLVGSNYLHVIAEDQAGNLSTASHYKFTINESAPSVASSSHPDTGLGNVLKDVSLEWTERQGMPLEQIAGYYYIFDDIGETKPTKSNSYTEENSISIHNVAPGEHYFHIRSKDIYDNLSPTTHLKIKVNQAVGPIISSTTHPNPTKNYSLNNVEFTWTDPEGLTEKYYYEFDQIPGTIPTQSSNLTTESKFTKLGIATQGPHFLHIISSDQYDYLSKVSHFRVNIGTGAEDSYLTLITPNGGENWVEGTTEQITWTSTDIDQIKIDYSVDNETNWNNIVPQIEANLQTYNWIVPNEQSEQCKIRIQSVTNPSIFNISENVFSITAIPKPILSLSSNNFNFGNVALNTTSSKNVSINNQGNALLEISNIEISNPSFSVNLPSSQIDGGASIELSINFTPTEEKTYSDSLVLYHNAEGSPTKIYLTGNGKILPVPVIELSVTSLEFGDVFLGQNQEKSFIIKNIGDTVLVVASVASSSSSFTVNTTSFSIEPDDSQTVLVNFSPEEEIEYNDSLIILHNSGIGTSYIELIGNGKSIPILHTNVQEINFNSVMIGDTKEELITVSNIGGSELNISNIWSDQSEYTASLSDVSITPDSAQDIIIYFQPTNSGLINGKLRLEHNGNGQLTTIDLLGTGFIYPTELTFNNTIKFDDVYDLANYQLIGIPSQSSFSIDDLLIGDNGENGDWRAFSDENGYGEYLEYDGSSRFNFTPGKGFWVISKNAISLSGNKSTVDLEEGYVYSIPLHAEWNIISNPFDKNIDWTSVQNLNNITELLHDFRAGNYTSSSTFQPYKGFYFNNATGLNSIKIPYVSETSTEQLFKSKPDTIKQIEINLIVNGVNTSDVTIGLDQNSKNGYDALDLFSPPSGFTNYHFSIFNEVLTSKYKLLKRDFRPDIGEGIEFSLKLQSKLDKEISIVLDNFEAFNEFEIYLLEERLLKLTNIKENHNYQFHTIHKNYNFKLLVGSEEFIDEIKENLLPQEFN
jgi:DNA/RNA endonuclease YhcR with UshA esterase domain